MKARTPLILFSTALFISIAGAYILEHTLTANILYQLAPLFAIGCGLYAIHTFKLSNISGQIFALLTAGITCFFIGELIFFYHQFISHTEPFPSAADFFFLLGYPFLFIGYVRAAFNHQVKWKNFGKLNFGSVFVFLILLAVLVGYFGVYKAYAPGDSVAANFISIAYGIGDLIIIAPSLFIIKIILDFKGGKLFYSWLLMLAGLASLLVGDLLFAYYRDHYNELIFPYTLIDLAYVAEYIFFGFSFWYTASTIKDLQTRLKK